ncbi:MAG: hypothetical protein WCO98_12950 [bacterium]
MVKRVFFCCLLVMMAQFAFAGDALDTALAGVSMTRDGFKVDTEAVKSRGNTAFKLSFFDQWYQHPLRIPFFERYLREQMLSAKGAPQPLFVTSASILGTTTWRSLNEPTPLVKYTTMAAKPDALKAAILAVDPRAKVPSTKNVPPQVQKLAAELLFVTADALKWREQALRKIPASDRVWLYNRLIDPLIHPEDKTGSKYERSESDQIGDSLKEMDNLGSLDLSLMFAGNDDMMTIVQAVNDELAKTPVKEQFNFTCKTKLGVISLSGSGNDKYTANAHNLLIFDTGGDDIYQAGGATGGAQYPVGIIIDGGGNDRYESSSTLPCFGAGVMGWGILVDQGGKDVYTTKGCYSQGCGIAGVGLLADYGDGEDTYFSLAGAQGYGYFGIGILADTGGSDSYETYVNGQGCGRTMGVGLLYDLTGNDKYTANDTDIIYPSAQTKTHNSSMCQGAGTGERRDYLDGHSVAGGVGMLLDGAGDDTYFGGVFSQAVGYWYGIGILDDRSGNDNYRSVWYGQSATAHFAVSYLVDGTGNDHYTSTNCVNVGAAHDFSVSLFVEESGDDIYEGASNMGQALNNSIALFVDKSGNDIYKGGSFGQAVISNPTGIRTEINTVGLFIDLDGNDTYPNANYGNNRTWTQQNKTPIPILRGSGVDVEKGELAWD